MAEIHGFRMNSLKMHVREKPFSLSTELITELNHMEFIREMHHEIFHAIVEQVAKKIAESLVTDRGAEIKAGINNDTITQAVIAAAVKRVQEELRGHSTANSGGGR